MKRFIIATLLALLLSTDANAQAATVDLNKATINWTFTPGAGSGVQEKFEVRCGQTTGVYTKVTTYAASAVSGNIRDVITGSGNWFCVVAAMNTLSEVRSTETPFVAAVGLSGIVTVIIK
jgi:hypothetical protein